MTSSKILLKDMIEALLSSGADNYTLDYIRTLLRENRTLYKAEERNTMLETIEQYFIDRECIFAETKGAEN